MTANFIAIVMAASLVGYMGTTLNWLIVFLGIGFLIFIHELGHFLVAKYEKVRVEAFALGFGPPIMRKKWGETDYRINIFPLGGYVKMAGELPDESRTGAPDEFSSKTPGQRARILIAGVFMNALFGLLVAIMAFSVGIRFVSPTIGYVQPGSPAWHAGLCEGDKILAIDGEQIASFESLIFAVAASDADQVVTLSIQRNGDIKDYQVLPRYDEARGLPSIGVEFASLPQISAAKDSWLGQAGLLRTDRILQIGDYPISDGHDILAALYRVTSGPLTIVVQRGKEKKVLRAELVDSDNQVYLLGIVTRQLKIGALRNGSPAEKCGFKIGDVLLLANGQHITNKEMLARELAPAEDLQITVRREQKSVILELAKDIAASVLDDIYFVPDLYVGEVIADSAASQVLRPGDKLVAINEQPLNRWGDLRKAVVRSAGSPMALTIERNHKLKTVTIAAAAQTTPALGNIQILRKMTEPQRYGLWEATKHGIKHAKQMAMQILLTIKGLANRRISPSKSLGGPITIFAVSHAYLQQFGFVEFLYFLALISINLAVLNLLPIPILDGGHLVFVTIEKLRGKPVSEQILMRTNYIGFLLLLSLLIYITFNDIARVFLG